MVFLANLWDQSEHSAMLVVLALNQPSDRVSSVLWQNFLRKCNVSDILDTVPQICLLLSIFPLLYGLSFKN